MIIGPAHTAIIFGSSRSNGNTYHISQELALELNIPIYNLHDFTISNFDYNHHNKDDDFLPLIRSLIEKYDNFVFTTPVYWYAMSAIMKTFFDRISDLLTIEKELGRKLGGKKVIFITSSIGNHLEDHFWIPIKSTCNYLDMKFIIGIHCIENIISKKQIEIIKKSI